MLQTNLIIGDYQMFAKQHMYMYDFNSFHYKSVSIWHDLLKEIKNHITLGNVQYLIIIIIITSIGC